MKSLKQSVLGAIGRLRGKPSAKQKGMGQALSRKSQERTWPLFSDYIDLLKDSGWEITHIVDCPLSTQRFLPNMVSHMQKNRTLGIVRRSLIIGRKKW